MLGYAEIDDFLDPKRRSRIMVFTDAMPNVGATDVGSFQSMVKAVAAHDIGFAFLMQWFVVVAFVSATSLGCDEQRSCPDDFSCDELVKLTCGESGSCADTQSCKAAKKLQTAGDRATCESAWCTLGETYRECE